MATITENGVAPAASGWKLAASVVARWKAARARRTCRASIAAVPPGLRADVGLDGGLPLARFENGGRTFVVRDRPDATLSGWYL